MYMQFDYENSEVLFNKFDLSTSLENNMNQLTREVETLAIPADAGIDDVARTLDKLAEKYKIELPTLNEKETYTSVGEKELDVSKDERLYISDRSKPFFKSYTSVTFHIPYAGDKEFFLMRASTITYNPPRAEVTNEELRLTFLIEGEVDGDQLKSEFNMELERIKQGLEWVRNDVSSAYNAELRDRAVSIVNQRSDKRNQAESILKDLGFSSAPTLSRSPGTTQKSVVKPAKELEAKEFKYDFFISYASEDKSGVAQPIYEALAGDYRVWFDEAELKLGDSLRKKIEEGLANCKFGIVVLSPTFFEKKWPEHELNALTARDISAGGGVILPIWHNLSGDDILEHHPSLADTKAVKFSDGIDAVTAAIIRTYNTSS
jgi:hypothetical protein